MTPYKTLTDEQLVDSLKAGEEGAFNEIYHRYWSLLFYTAHNIIRNQESAQDVVQNVYISLWQRRNETDIRFLKPYLQQSARFLVFKEIREMQKDARFYLTLKEITSEIIIDNPLLFKEQQALLKRLLGTLPEKHRETFRLSREEGFTYKQIASCLNISEKAVEKRLSKSLRVIRRGLELEMCVAIIMASAGAS